MKKIVLCLCCAALAFFMSGCNFSFGESDALMRPPKLVGDHKHMQDALEKKVGKGIVLRYPTSGNNRSAFVPCDLDGDGEEEVLVFYGVVQNGSAAGTNINVLDKIDGVWQSVGDMAGGGTQIDSVDFSDLDGNGTKEIITGWDIISSRDKGIKIYAFHKQADYHSVLATIFDNTYTEKQMIDIDQDGLDEIVTVTLNTATKTAFANLIQMTEKGCQITSKSPLDGSVTGYAELKSGYLKDGARALYLDGYKGSNAAITELIYFTKELVTPFYDPIEQLTKITQRNTTMLSRDIDGDGIIEIPMAVEFPGYVTKPEQEKIYLTHWYKYDGASYTEVLASYSNVENGYEFRFPKKWADIVTIRPGQVGNTVTFCEWIPSASKTVNSLHAVGSLGKDIMSIKVMSQADWEQNPQDSYELIKTKNGVCYCAKVNPEINKITIPEIMQHFSLLESR